MYEKRRYVPIQHAAKVAGAYDYVTGTYQWWLVDPENMGCCKDGCTRWYHFRAEDGTPSYGKKRYEDMTKEEQHVVDSFQGKERYQHVLDHADYYLPQSDPVIPLLPSAAS